MSHVGLLWTGMSIYDDLSGHGLEAHSRWVGSRAGSNYVIVIKIDYAKMV